MEDNSIFFQCQVLSNEDPMMLGRIRGYNLAGKPYEDILKSVTDPPWNESVDIWTARDPLVFNPLLPYFLYSIPKKGELVQIMFVNKDFQYQNQYYVQNTFSTPTATFGEFNIGANKYTGTGMQNKNAKPLKNQNGTYTENSVHEGVFPQPGDNALLGRGSADLIVKQDEVLLRAGKFQGQILQPNVPPVANTQRGFLQLSKFQSIKQPLDPRTYFELKEQVVLTKYLIEWVISNPENETKNPDGTVTNLFAGEVYLYQLKPDASVNSKNISVSTVVPENIKTLVALQSFSLLSLQDTIKFINDFIKTCNTKNVTATGTQLFPDNNDSTKFPIYYRPNNLMYDKLNPSTTEGSSASNVAVKNISAIYKGIKLNPALKGGYGLIYAKNKVGIPKTVVKKTLNESQYINNETTYGALGSDSLFLLSHKSQIPGKGKINFDNTLYGISAEKFADEIIPKTSSLVRGEELLELINMIVRFLVTHTHAYPGLPPTTKTQDGSTVDKLLTELQNAVTKILNGNIRLN